MTGRSGSPWSEVDDQLLTKYYADEVTAKTAERLGRTTASTYARAKKLGLRKSQAFLTSPASGRVKGNVQYRHWTEEEIATLRARYPHEKTERVAEAIGRTVTSCYARAKKEGLRKTQEYLDSPDAGRADGTIGQASRFRKGHVPSNKGVKGWQAGGRSAETQFKKGQKSANYCPVGSYARTTKERFWILKVRDDGLQRERWIPLHKLVWIEHHGPIPDGHIIRFKDGNVDNVAIENLECITKAENMKRNTIHNLPKELVGVIHAKAALTRAINKQVKVQHEEQQ